MNASERSKFFFNLIRRMAGDNDRGLLDNISQWRFLGQAVCFNAFLALTGTSNRLVRRLQAAVLSGAPDAPLDGRACREVRLRPAVQSVEAYFSFLHTFVAEPLAEGEVKPEEAVEPTDQYLFQKYADDDSAEGPVADDFSLWIVGQSCIAAAEGPRGEQRWLNHMNLTDLYSQYCHNFQASEDLPAPASKSVFYRAWKEWKKVLRFRRPSQHAKCTDCVRYALYRLKAKSDQEKAAIQKAYNQHLQGVFADRNLAKCLQTMSELSCAENSNIPPSERLLYLQVDGMDQAPRPK